MSRLLSALICLLSVLALSPAFAGGIDTEASPDAHEVVVNGIRHDFGVVTQGETVEHGFRLHNRSEQALKIRAIDIGEEGLSVQVGKVIEAGGEIEARVSLDTSSYRRHTEASLKLSFDDPQVKPLALTLAGTVIPPVDILPLPVAFLSQYTGENKVRTLTIQNNRERPLAIERLEPLGRHFTARLETSEPGKLYQLHIFAAEDAGPGRYREALVLHTDDPERALLHIQVNVLIKPDIFLSKESVEFGTISLSQLRTQPNVLQLLADTVLIKRKSGEMALTSVASDIAFLKLDQDPVGRAQNFQLNVGLVPEKLEKGAFSGTIKISTDDPEHPEIAIPVHGEVVD